MYVPMWFFVISVSHVYFNAIQNLGILSLKAATSLRSNGFKSKPVIGVRHSNSRSFATNTFCSDRNLFISISIVC